MQLSELISAVRDEVQDPNASRWSDSTITRYLNDAQLDLARISRKLTMWRVDVSVNDTYVLFPDDLLIPKTLWFEMRNWRYPLDIKYGVPPESSAVTGAPAEAYIIGEHIYFYPTVNCDGYLYIAGTARPTQMSAPTDTPSVIDADNLLIAYASWMCLLSDGDPLAAVKKDWYDRLRTEWGIMDAQRNPMPDRIEHSIWW